MITGQLGKKFRGLRAHLPPVIRMDGLIQLPTAYSMSRCKVLKRHGFAGATMMEKPGPVIPMIQELHQSMIISNLLADRGLVQATGL